MDTQFLEKPFDLLKKSPLTLLIESIERGEVPSLSRIRAVFDAESDALGKEIQRLKCQAVALENRMRAALSKLWAVTQIKDRLPGTKDGRHDLTRRD